MNSKFKNSKLSFSDYVGSFLGIPFKRGGNGRDGFDCIGFCHTFFTGRGKPFPTTYCSMVDYMKTGEMTPITLANYHEYYKADRDAADDTLLEFAETIGKPVRPPEAVAGDFVVVKHTNGHFFPAVYTGNGNCVAAFLGRGVCVIPLSRGVAVVVARRL